MTPVIPESPEYLSSVAAWRNAWRPRQVRVLLVAESHVGETEGDRGVRVTLPFHVEEAMPSTYCRLVYCLGYGEPGICHHSPASNRGTPQYWRIFADVAGMSPPTRALFPSLHDRVWHKLAILRAMRDRGIWLVDASTTALYRRGVPGKPKDYKQVIRTSWEREVWPSVSTDPVLLTYVIGLGVQRALAGLPGLRNARVITQPQDRTAGRHRDGLRELAEAIREIGVA